MASSAHRRAAAVANSRPFGPFARSLEDIALALDVIAGFDADDPDTRPLAAKNFQKTTTENFGG